MNRMEAKPPTERAVLPARDVRLSAEPHAVGVPGSGSHTELVVSPIKDGEQIVGAQIICRCGERIRLRFDYGPET